MTISATVNYYRNLLSSFSKVFALLVLAGSVSANDFSVASLDKAPPAELGETIKAELGKQAYTISAGDKPMYELWLRKALPLKSAISSPSKALDAIGQTTLMGAMKILGDERDYRDDELYPGTYTVRFGLRPQDGNHLGTSDHLYFAVLIEAKNDQELGKISRSKQLTRASSKTSATDHPMILSLYPVSAADAETPSVHEPAPEHKAIRLSIPTVTAEGKEAGAITFDLVVEGVAEF